MIKLEGEKQYAEFGKAFLTFYLENGFGNRTKTDIDLKIFSLLQPHLKGATCRRKALDLQITSGRYNNLLTQSTFRFSQQNIDEELKGILLDCLTDTAYGFDNNNIKIMLSDPRAKDYFYTLCQDNNFMADTSFNRDIVTIRHGNFAELLAVCFKNREKQASQLCKEYSIKFYKNKAQNCLKSAIDTVLQTIVKQVTADACQPLGQIPALLKSMFKMLKK